MTPSLERALAHCANEPIHLSGAIQPHGFLISCQLPDWTIRHVSANVESLTGAAPDAMLRRSLREFLTDDLIQAIAETIGFGEPGAASQRAAVGNIGPMAQLCDVSVHVVDGLVHIEIEPQPRSAAERSPTVVAQTMIARVAASDDIDDFNHQVAEQVRLLTGYDRVMVYRFRHDDAGEVVAESRASELTSYLGLRYPASDIPVQARTLYLRNRLRVIPDASYVPVPILPDRDARGGALDLSQMALRSVSPVHLQYLANMGVVASMSISIVAGGRLWGLIACHHRTPRRVPPGVRAAADMFGLFVSMRVASREQQQAVAQEDGARSLRDALALRLDNASEPRLALSGELDLVRRNVDCDGVGLLQAGHWHSAGRAPDASRTADLLAWLGRANPGTGAVSADRALDWLGAGEQADGLAGVLAIPLDPGKDEWLFFFRCEQIEEVRWAGAPDTPFVFDQAGGRIGPRASFTAWHETVRGTSVPWTDADRRIVGRLHMLLRERYRRGTLGLGIEVGDINARRVRMDVSEQRARLLQLSDLLEGLVHVTPQEAAQLSERIQTLEGDLQSLIDPVRVASR